MESVSYTQTYVNPQFQPNLLHPQNPIQTINNMENLIAKDSVPISDTHETQSTFNLSNMIESSINEKENQFNVWEIGNNKNLESDFDRIDE